jgi:hypothetical protein
MATRVEIWWSSQVRPRWVAKECSCFARLSAHRSDACSTCQTSSASRAPCACQVREACAAGLGCSVSATSQACGTCVPEVPLGGPCTHTDECARSVPGTLTFCDFNTDLCTAITPADTQARLGEPCGRVAIGPSQFRSVSCEVGFTCGESELCEPVSAPEGAECIASNRCNAGLVCVGVVGTSPGPCALPRVGGLGDSCDDLAMTLESPRTCDGTLGLVCLFGTCSPIPAEEGAGCSRSTDCAEELVCWQETCRPPLREGAACGVPWDCASGACIDNVCQASCG